MNRFIGACGLALLLASLVACEQQDQAGQSEAPATGAAPVTAADAAGNVVFRSHGTDSAGGVVADAAILLNTDCYFQVVKIAELNE